MSQPTFIPGKDAALEESISHFQKRLSELGFTIEEASWLNPVPHVWSVHIRDRDCPHCFTNGKGASKKAALASALGEYFERLATNYFFADFYLGEELANAPFVHYRNEKWFPLEGEHLPHGLLDEHTRKFYNPEGELSGEMMLDLQSNNEERGIVALPFVRQSDQKTVYFPMNVVANLYVSNGMSAGNTPAEARVQALSEIFERHIKNRIISEAIALPQIPDDVLSRYPHINASIAALEAEGFPIYAFDASLGGHYPVICVVLLNPENGTCFASFGAHPRFEVALERAVTELLQGRSLKDLDSFLPPSFDNDEVADHHNLETHFIDSSGLISWDLFKSESDFEFVDWNFVGSTDAEFAHLIEIFTLLEEQVYIADYDHLGVYACRIIVPGMSEIYPVEDLTLANNNMGGHLREVVLALPELEWSEEEFLEFFEQLDEEGHDDRTRVRELLGIVAEQGSAMHTLRIGELKAMLALAGGDLESAQEWIEWTLDFNQSVFSRERLNYYRALRSTVELLLDEERDPEHYTEVFSRLYGSKIATEAWEHATGVARFHGLTACSLRLEAYPQHQKLLEAYAKVQAVK